MTDAHYSSSEAIYAFGPFKLLPQRKLLLRDDRALRIGSRAFEILAFLIERPGEMIGKEELFARVWPGVTVEEINLRVNVAALRRALGESGESAGYITNAPGRGYCFSAPVTQRKGAPLDEAPEAPVATSQTLPVRLTRMIGRNDVVRAVQTIFESSRFVTLVGAGGIGKTTVALAAARNLTERFSHGVHFIDFSPLTDGSLAASAVASSLGISTAPERVLPDLLAFVQARTVLLMLDNCEHVIDAAALLSESLLQGAPGLQILATSREPLRAAGEWVFRLPPMAVPEQTEGLTADEAQHFPAIELFVERASATSGSFAITDENAQDVANLCRRLDGLPLAIELAAARVGTLGIQPLSARLADRFLTFGEGRRTSQPRQQTLQATLEWSFGLLTAHEKAVLRALSIYRGAFDLDSAVAVASAEELDEGTVISCLESLTEKSLVSFSAGQSAAQYRLLESTRAYALGKLHAAGEHRRVSQRHAERLATLLARSEADWDVMSANNWLASYGPLIDDVRTALVWGLSPGGDIALALHLTVSALPLWMHLSLASECIQTANLVIERSAGLSVDAPERLHQRMKLLNALGQQLIYIEGPGRLLDDSLDGALMLARALDDVEYQLRAIWGSFVAKIVEADYAAARHRAEAFRDTAARSRNPSDRKAGERMMGFALHLLGDQIQARTLVEGMLKSYIVPTRRSDYVRFQFDQRVAGRVPFAAILWLQGKADQAIEHATQAVEEAQSINHAVSLGYALSTGACLIAVLTGDLDAAGRFVQMLSEHSAAYRLGPWGTWGRYFESLLQARNGDRTGIEGMRDALEELRRTGFLLRYSFYLAQYADVLAEFGQLVEAMRVIDTAQAHGEACQEGWCAPELLRIKGEILRHVGGADSAEKAADLFNAAIDLAQASASPAWALRAANSLSRLYVGQGEPSRAYDLLMPIYDSFTEGYSTADLMEAKRLLKFSTPMVVP